MRGYEAPVLRALGSMAAVTRKSGTRFDIETFQQAESNVPPICQLFPFLQFCQE